MYGQNPNDLDDDLDQDPVSRLTKPVKPATSFIGGVKPAAVQPASVQPAASGGADRKVSLEEWDEMVIKKYGIPRNLFKSMTEGESNNNIGAVSPTRVRGRQQVTEAVAKGYGLDRNDPFQQSLAAWRYLREQYDGIKDVEEGDKKWLGALARYYAGGGATKGDTVSGSSVDGLSNPVIHVKRIASMWGDMNKREREGDTPTSLPRRLMAKAKRNKRR